MSGATVLQLWKKEIRVANHLRRRNPKGHAEFVRDLAAQKNGDDWHYELLNSVSPGRDYARRRDQFLESEPGSIF
jgi:hypothetical protein